MASSALQVSVSPDPALEAALDAACGRIAPTWPLDQFIAVNPFWGWIEQPVATAAARLGALSGSRLLMPRAWYREQWRAGRFETRHLAAAIAHAGASCSAGDLVALLAADEAPLRRRTLVTDVTDTGRDLAHAPAWCDFVTNTTSQFCAAFFDEGQAQLTPAHGAGLYPAWRAQAPGDLSPALLMGLKAYRTLARQLPADPHELIAVAVDELGIPVSQREPYFTALLLRLNGWASWCAYRRWQARLAGADDDQIVHLLALRLAWELLLYRAARGNDLAARWSAAVAAWPAHDGAAAASLSADWLLQRALELAYQETLCRGLLRPAASAEPAPPSVQAAFCIDVRSEVFRRALEAASPRVQTLGFAGFFGLPIEYRPLGARAARPQLPGLLAPALQATDASASPQLTDRRALRLDLRGAWKQLKTAPVSGFSFVEALGLFYAGKLVTDSLGRTRPVPHPERAGLTRAEHAQCKPRLSGSVDGAGLEAEARADLAAGVLRAMSLTMDFARIVLLAGHGSETVNNPHAAGLDCGACCGQTGEVNARALAALLNEASVRDGLAARGIHVPESTWFVAGLHNTTTDHVELFDLDELPATHAADLDALQAWLAEAGRRARAERAAGLGLAGLDEPALRAAVEERARDWSQVRPEWGLANNAAFIVAPRARSRGLDLAGRSFLHDYRWREDADFSVLELIMTAPMVVTHWINLQYYASTVDNARYGSGNKVLHNVVGARLGVFEGNGGDLRIGLPLQSLHDGERWVHTPLRLNVFIEAPRDAIDAVLEKHAHVRRLVENDWLFLFQIDAEEASVHARHGGGWVDASRAPAR